MKVMKKEIDDWAGTGKPEPYVDHSLASNPVDSSADASIKKRKGKGNDVIVLSDSEDESEAPQSQNASTLMHSEESVLANGGKEKAEQSRSSQRRRLTWVLPSSLRPVEYAAEEVKPVQAIVAQADYNDENDLIPLSQLTSLHGNNNLVLSGVQNTDGEGEDFEDGNEAARETSSPRSQLHGNASSDIENEMGESETDDALDEDYRAEEEDPDFIQSGEARNVSVVKHYHRRGSSRSWADNRFVSPLLDSACRDFIYKERKYSYSPDVFSHILEVPVAGRDIKEVLSELGKEGVYKFFDSSTGKYNYNISDFGNFGTPEQEMAAKNLMQKWHLKLHPYAVNKNACGKRLVVAAMSVVGGQAVNYPQSISDYMHHYVSTGRSHRVWNLCTAVIDFHSERKEREVGERRALSRTRQEVADLYVDVEGDGDMGGDVGGAANVSNVLGNTDPQSALVPKSHELEMQTDSNSDGVQAEEGAEKGMALIGDLGTVDVINPVQACGSPTFEVGTPVKVEPKVWSQGLSSKDRDAEKSRDKLEFVISRTGEQIVEMLANDKKHREKAAEEDADLSRHIREQRAAGQILERNLERFHEELRALEERGKSAADKVRHYDQNISLLEKQRDDLLNSEQTRKRLQEAKSSFVKRQREEEQKLVKDVFAAAQLAKKIAVPFHL